jgi:cyclophilin family peptidyl-prolyl cis-trans isomerase
MSRFGVSAFAICCLFAASAAAQQAAAPAGTQPAQPPAQGAAGDQAAAPGAKSPAAAAYENFEASRKQWLEIKDKLQATDKERQSAKGDARAKLDAQIAEQRKAADDVLKKLCDAGLAVFKADSKAYPRVTETMVVIAGFFINGDENGDGGDQYERAKPLIKGLIDAGGGETWPQLYVWGALAAYCTNDFDLSQQYFAKAPSPTQQMLSPPQAQNFEVFRKNLPSIKEAWAKEKQLREAEAKADNLPRVKMTTTKGDVVIELFEDQAPQSVANFITLVKQGFYNGLSFHRVLPAFMAQGGDPKGDGTGGPGYTIRDEQHLPNYRHHFRGSLSMAHSQLPNSGGSQFFLTFVPTSYLDGEHAVFGRVIEGMEAAASLNRGEPPRVPDKIVKAEVLRDRGHAYKFEKLPDK